MTQSADATSRREEEGESLPPSLPTCDLRRQRERRPGPEEVGGMGPPHSRCPLAKVKGMRLEPGLNTPHRRRGSKPAHTDGDGLQRRANCDHCPLASDADRFRAANRADSRLSRVSTRERSCHVCGAFKYKMDFSPSSLEWTTRRITLSEGAARRGGSVANLGSGCPFRCVCGIRALYKAELTWPCDGKE